MATDGGWDGQHERNERAEGFCARSCAPRPRSARLRTEEVNIVQYDWSVPRWRVFRFFFLPVLSLVWEGAEGVADFWVPRDTTCFQESFCRRSFSLDRTILNRGTIRRVSTNLFYIFDNAPSWDCLLDVTSGGDKQRPDFGLRSSVTHRAGKHMIHPFNLLRRTWSYVIFCVFFRFFFCFFFI